VVPLAINIISIYRFAVVLKSMLYLVTNIDQYLWKLMVPFEYRSVTVYKSNPILLEAYGSIRILASF
jgi:hypothetical protein